MKTLILIIFILAAASTYSQNDTLKTYFDRSSGFKVYTFIDDYDNLEYPLTGTNYFANMIGSKFIFYGKAKLVGALVAFAKATVGAGIQNAVVVMELQSDGKLSDLPDAIGLGYFLTKNIKINSQAPEFNYFQMNANKNPILSSNFVVMVQTLNDMINSDKLEIFSNKQGDGQLQKTSFRYWVDNNGKYRWQDLYDFPLKTEIGDKPDIDVMIIPVMDYNDGVEDGLTFDGITLKSVYPNPANDKIHFLIENPLNIQFEISLIDEAGKTVNNIQPRYSDGEIDIDVKNLPLGNYFYYFKTPNTKFAGRIVIER